MTNSEPEPKARTYIQQARRAQLCDCALEVLAEVGYAQASLVQIAKRAGVSRGVITYHFADREELFDAAVNQVYDTARAFLQPRMQSEQTAAGALRTFIIGSAEFYRDSAVEMAALHEIVINSRDSRGRLRRSAGSADDGELAALRSLLERGQRAGEFRDFTARVMARSIRFALNGLLQDLQTVPDLDVMSDAEELAALFDRATRR